MWFSLQKKRSTDIVAGELRLCFEKVDQAGFEMVKWAEADVATLLVRLLVLNPLLGLLLLNPLLPPPLASAAPVIPDMLAVCRSEPSLPSGVRQSGFCPSRRMSLVIAACAFSSRA